MHTADSILPRTIQSLFARSLETMPVVVLMGARQTGKGRRKNNCPIWPDSQERGRMV